MISTTFSGKDLSLHSQLAPVLVSRQEQSQGISGYTKSKALSQVESVLHTSTRKAFDFWKEWGLNFISSLAGVVVTAKLRIQGWAVIPASLLAVSTTRGLIEYLECELPIRKTEAGRERVLSSPRKLAALNHNSGTTESTSKIAYSVVHAIPGRIRLRVPRITHDLEYTQRLEKLLKTDATVASIRVNRDAASIAINYRSDGIPVSYWLNLLQLADKATSIQTSYPSEVQVAEANVLANLTAEKTQPPFFESVSPVNCTVDLTPNECTEVKNRMPLSEPASSTSIADSTTVMLHPTTGVASPWVELIAQIPQLSLGWCCRLANRVAARVSHLTRLRQVARDAVVAIRSQQTSI